MIGAQTLKYRLLSFVAVLAFARAAAMALPQQGRYDIDPTIARSNVSKAVNAAKAAGKPEAAIIPFVVPAMSGIRRCPDSFPEDGAAFAPLRWIAARDEFEPASIVLLANKNFDGVIAKAGDLVGPGGATIPASAIDIKIVKAWYQGGSAWHGYFADSLGRALTPELLLNDEDLVRVDMKTRDNFVRYETDSGERRHAWMSARFEITDYTFANQANQGLIFDAQTLQPFTLVAGEAKQIMATLHVPVKAAHGIYEGNIELRQAAGGPLLATIPMQLRVLPFELPIPRTLNRLDREFYLVPFGTPPRNPSVLQNLAQHNVRQGMMFRFFDPLNPAAAAELRAMMERAGMSTRPIFGGAEGVGLRIPEEEENTPCAQRKIARLSDTLAKTHDWMMKNLGHADVYSYGVDEGGPDTVRAERAAWRTAHEVGTKTMVSGHFSRHLIFDLDFLIVPGMPTPARAKEVALFKESNPNAIIGWYADPHSGPENPDYFRRLHGMMSYKAGYDAAANYCWWRNNWNDMAVPYEPFLRGLVMIYGTRDSVLDTLAWEGVREGLDDVRYTTLLRERATALLDGAKGAQAASLARRALAFLAYWDERRGDINAYRAECTRWILELITIADGSL